MKPLTGLAILGGVILIVFVILINRRAKTLFEGQVVNRLAEGFARAEGFYVAGSRAQRNHNPGNITKDITGKGVGMDGMFIVYRNDADGFEALRKQIWLMFGGSMIYNSSMTLLEVAKRYTTTQPLEWAKNVAGYLGVSINTQLSQIKPEVKTA